MSGAFSVTTVMLVLVLTAIHHRSYEGMDVHKYFSDSSPFDWPGLDCPSKESVSVGTDRSDILFATL